MKKNNESIKIFFCRKVKGPCWLEIRGASVSNPPVSWCKVEAFCDNPGLVSVLSQVRKFCFHRTEYGNTFCNLK